MSFTNEETIRAHGGTPVSTRALDQTDHSVHDKQCCTCLGIFPHNHFQKDSSYRDGHRDRCHTCEQTPRLSTAEHTHRLSELNFNSASGQRWQHQLDYMDDDARHINQMHYSDFISRLRRALPNQLFFMDGRVAGDIAVYRVFGQPQADGFDFKYQWYIPVGFMPEYSLYEFDQRAVPVRERIRGWRTPLLRLVKSSLLTEEKCNKFFGEPIGPASVVWRRQMFVHRNQHD